MADFIKVDNSGAVLALSRYDLLLAQKSELMDQIGAGQLVSIRRTFREQGSPSNSWAPLAPSTVKKDPKRYGAGHKILIGKGRLLNSITYHQTRPGQVVVGTNLIYGPVHQFGSRDRSVAIGPQTKAQSEATVKVAGYSYFRLANELGTGKLRGQKRRMQGPLNARQVNVGAHGRHQNIPPRPYVVFRPEDPARIQRQVGRFVAEAKRKSGLEGA